MLIRDEEFLKLVSKNRHKLSYSFELWYVYQDNVLLESGTWNQAIDEVMNIFHNEESEDLIKEIGEDLTGYTSFDLLCYCMDNEPKFTQEFCLTIANMIGYENY